MRADYLSYKKATGVSVLGLALQVLFTVVTLIYGVLSADHTALSASVFMGVGIFAWLAIAIVFDQHRRERIEAMEAESLAGGGAGGSVFESKDEEFRVAARRLAGMYKYFLPAVSLVLAAALIGFGIWRFTSGRPLVAPGATTATGLPGWQLGIGITFAFIGFIFARYASGMAKQAVWQNLRAGASYAVGSAILALSLATAQIVDTAGPDVIERYLHVIVPVFLVLIGAEIILNFVLDIYRPRKGGETPRPAFDSRVLGFAAAPDRIAQSISEAINYQLGFDVTSGWFYQLLSRSLAPLLIVGLLVMWAMSCVVVLQPHQNGMILRFGARAGEPIGPGWHWKRPWPIDTVAIPEYVKLDGKGKRFVADYTATGLRTVQLGTPPPGTAEPILWTNDHLGDEVFQLVSSGQGAVATDAGEAGGNTALADFALVSMELPLQYSVLDVDKYDQLAPPMMRDDLLKVTAQRELTRFFQTVTLDDVLGPRRFDLSGEIRRRINAAFDQLNPDPVTGKPLGAGVEIVFAGIVGVHPPKDKDIALSFEKVVEADQRYQARMDGANAEQIKSLTLAAGDVSTANSIVAGIDALEKAERDHADAKLIADLESRLATLLDAAGGKTASKIADAKGDRWLTHMQARGRASEYIGQLKAYETSPGLYRANVYFDALKGMMANARVYITDPDVAIRAELQDKESNVGVFKDLTQDK